MFSVCCTAAVAPGVHKKAVLSYGLRLGCELWFALVAEQGAMADAAGTETSGDTRQAPGEAPSEHGWQASYSGWWGNQAGDQAWQWQWQPGSNWGSYAGAGWSGASYGNWSWQWAPSWGDAGWRSATGETDSSRPQKPGQQESGAGGGGDHSGGSGDAPDTTETNRRQSASTTEDDPWATAEGTGSLDDDVGSSAKTPTAPKSSGKDFIPEYDGTGPMREYQRRVKLFELSTGIDPSFRAQKLMEKLTGNAWLATESIPLESLKHPDGVARLLEHLWKELEPLEFLRTFQTLADFYKGFRRGRGQEFVAYDMEFRRHGQRLEEINAGLSGVTKAYWFLEKAGLSPELRKQVVAAAGEEYDYNKLRAAVMAIVPQVNKEDEHQGNHHSGGQHPRQWRKASKVHATTQEESEDTFQEGDGEEDPNPTPELLEEELQVLLTQAAKKRAQVEKARGFSSSQGSGKGGSRGETPEARAKRIAELKQRMPCSACKANGRTTYGHWHGDPECPFNRGQAKNGAVLAVVEQELSDSDEDYGPEPTSIFMTECDAHVGYQCEHWCASAISSSSLHEHDCLLALSDTCCARSVAGEGWAKAHINHLHEAGLDAYIVDEMRPFRFGAGPKIASKYSVIIPLHVPQASNVPWMRVSIVDQDVPLLLSKSALKALGARLDLGAARVELSKLDTSLDLVETASGLCGFVINREGNKSAVHLPFPPVDMLEGEMEVFMGAPSTPQRPSDLGSAVHVCPQVNTEGKHPVLESERLAKEYLTAGFFSYQNLQEVVELLPNVNPDRQRAINGGAKRPRSGLMGGLWAHGGFHGVSKTVKKFPYTIKYVNAFMRERCDREHWTSFVVLKNVKTNLHKDNHNAPGSKTITVTFGDFQGGELWIEGGQDGDRAIRKDMTGQWVKGVSVSAKHSPFLLDPKCQHGTQPWTGTRWCLSCYTARSYSNIDASMKASLIELGFPLPTVPATRTFGESSNVC